jgi:signal transduction histidine kinase/ligand-binding sensor domain-containing protein
MATKCLWFWLLCLFASAYVQSQALHSARQFTVYDGLSSDGIVSIAQDNISRIWAITLNGVCHFQGNNWQKFSSPLTLPNDPYSKFTKDRHGNLWITGATELGFFIGLVESVTKIRKIGYNLFDLNPGYFGRYGFEVLYQGSDTVLFLGHGNKLFSLNLKSEEKKGYELPNEVKISDLAFQNQSLAISNMSASTDDAGIYFKTGNIIAPFEVIPAKERCFQITPTEQGLCVMCENNAYLVSESAAKKFDLSSIPKSSLKDYKLISATDKSLLGIKSGIFFSLSLTTGKTSILNVGNYSLNHPIVDLLKTDEYIWLATPNGIFRTNLSYQSYTSDNGLPSDEVSLLLNLSQNRKLLCSHQGLGLFKDEKLEKKIYFPQKNNEPFKYRIILDAIEYQDKVLLAASDIGFLSLDPESFKLSDFPLKTEHAYAIEKKGDTLLLAFMIEKKQNVLCYYKDNKILKKISLKNGYIRRIKVFQDGRIFILGHGIACEIVSGKCRDLLSIDKKIPKIFDAVHTQEHGTLLGTSEGAAYIRGDSIIKLKWFDLQNPIYVFLIDHKNRLWMGTDDGLYCYDGKQLNHIARHQGLVGYDVSRRALIQDEKNLIWVGTNQGLSFFDPKVVEQDKSEVKLYFSSIMANDEEIQNDILLPYSKNNLEFDFEGASHAPENLLFFRAKLHGFDQDWNPIQNARHKHIRYTNLPPGKYHLEIQARFKFRDWNNTLLSPSITIKKPFYMQIWFLITAWVFLVWIVYQAVQFFNRLKNEKKLEVLLEQKTREIRSNEKELEEKNQQLTKVNKDLDRFVYSVSHDIKAPLASLKGVISLLKMESMNPQVAQYIKYIEQSVIKLDIFVKELIDYSRNVRTEIKIKEIDFHSLVKEALEESEYQEGYDKIDKIVEIDDQFRFYSDKRRISVILNNLINNAIKYHNPCIEKPFVKIYIQVRAHDVYIEIQDNGLGIEQSDQERIFEMFYRANEQKSGSGLGLYIVKETMDRLGGRIELQSEPNKGSLFRLVLPNLISESKVTSSQS